MSKSDRRRWASYVRVSTRDERQSFRLQRHAIQQFCNSRDADLVAEFADKISGEERRRPGLDDLLNAVYGGAGRDWDAVVVYKLDRLSRRGIFGTIELTLQFETCNVDLISVTEPIDTSTPIGRAFFAIAAAFGEIELDRIRSRIRDGLDAARAAGKVLGRPAVIMPEKHLERMVELRLRWFSWADIAREFSGKYKVGTIRNRVKRRLKLKGLKDPAERKRWSDR